jgi:pimeloyl-ACP methyl ester carboxylesterase
LVEGVRHVDEHVADARVGEVPGAGHSCMPARPEKLVDELVQFFAPRLADVAGR